MPRLIADVEDGALVSVQCRPRGTRPQHCVVRILLARRGVVANNGCPRSLRLLPWRSLGGGIRPDRGGRRRDCCARGLDLGARGRQPRHGNLVRVRGRRDGRRQRRRDTLARRLGGHGGRPRLDLLDGLRLSGDSPYHWASDRKRGDDREQVARYGGAQHPPRKTRRWQAGARHGGRHRRSEFQTMQGPRERPGLRFRAALREHRTATSLHGSVLSAPQAAADSWSEPRWRRVPGSPRRHSRRSC